MNDAVGFFDAVCPKCKRKIGWHGTVLDRPACSCGHRINPVDLERDQATLNEAREILRELGELKERTRQGVLAGRWQVYRVVAGLTRGQAARLLGVSITELSAIESGQCAPDAEMVAKMAELYGG